MPAENDIEIYQGDSYELIFRLRDAGGNYMNLTGAVPKAQIRATPESGVVLAEFDADLLTQSGDTLGGVSIKLTGAQTALLPPTPEIEGRFYYDAQLTNGTDIKTHVYGRVKVYPEVTRA